MRNKYLNTVSKKKIQIIMVPLEREFLFEIKTSKDVY